MGTDILFWKVRSWNVGDRLKGVDLDPARGGRSAQERHLHAVQSVSSSHSESLSGCETKISPSRFTMEEGASIGIKMDST